MYMRHVMRCAIGLMVVTLLGGCSSSPTKHGGFTSFKPKAENRVTEKKLIHISREFVALEGKRRTGLIEGDYLALYKDAGGVYYQGPGWCVYQVFIGSKHGSMMRGGLYVPNSGSIENPVIYWNSDIGGIATTQFDANGYPLLTKEQKAEAAKATQAIDNYILNQSINAGSVAGAAGTGLGYDLIGAFVQGTISWLPIPETTMRELMKYVTQK